MRQFHTRAAWLLPLCLILSGCAASIRSTDLKPAASQPESTQLLGSVGFVIHPFAGPKAKIGDRRPGVPDPERASWVRALSAFTDEEKVFFVEGTQPTPVHQAIAELAKSQPIVTIDLSTEGNDSAWWPVVSIATLGIIPAYYTEPYTAVFTLSMPQGSQVPPSRREYNYRRQEFMWFLVLPFANHLLTQAGSGDTDSEWQDEEKRRLLLRFLIDAEPRLRERAAR